MKTLRTRALVYALALTAGSAYAASPFRLGVVAGDSMAPTLASGSVYVLDRAAYLTAAPQRGDVIVFRRGAQTFVKRVLAVAGDAFFVQRRDGDLQGDSLVRDFELDGLRRLARDGRVQVSLSRRVVPPGFLYAVGDNLDHSEDSRSFGFVPLEDVVGRLEGAPVASYGLYEARRAPHNQVLHEAPRAAG